VVRLLLAFGADPNQRGLNDWTALHMAVAERNGIALLALLDAGADRELRTRIDDCDTPLEMAESAGLSEMAALLREAPPSKRK
jgi:ankyrin repeat protein